MKMKSASPSRSIQLLRDSVAQKIAAGEVIDRPFSVLRELLDNAIDSGAGTVEVHIEGGGTRLVRVVDNGCGMERQDLELCYLPHATSKISEIEDLERIDSMGFRGEALASIAACSRLEITSTGQDGQAHTLRVENGRFLSLSPSRGRGGTSAQAADLFYTIPARKHFLKSDKAELAACRKLFTEKALAFPGIAFRFFSEGEMKLFFPPSDQKDRIVAAYPEILKPGMLHTISGQEDLFSFTALAAGPGLYRRDRRMIHIYVNRRKIEEFSLLQAVSHGYGEYLPGGSYPVCFLFLTVRPDRIDFNIHPAKREVRFRDLKRIHHVVSSGIRSYLEEAFPSPLSYGESDTCDAGPDLYEHVSDQISDPMSDRTVASPTKHQPEAFFRIYDRAKTDLPAETAGIQDRPGYDFRYLGQVFGLFLAVEKGDSFYLVDQHAAHERILYDRFTRGAIRRQPLLIPRSFTVDGETARLIGEAHENIEKLGIGLEATGTTEEPPTDGQGVQDVQFHLTSLPETCVHLEEEIITILEEYQESSETLMERLFADLSCKAAVKEGEYLPPEAAKQLVSETFQLEQKRCPHGRPVWFTISEKMLYKAVGRV